MSIEAQVFEVFQPAVARADAAGGVALAAGTGGVPTLDGATPLLCNTLTFDIIKDLGVKEYCKCLLVGVMFTNVSDWKTVTKDSKELKVSDVTLGDTFSGQVRGGQSRSIQTQSL